MDGRALMENEVCRFLGLIDEQGAYLTYPSFENRCYATTLGSAIPLNEQTFFCLGGNHERCPRYRARLEATSETGPPADESAVPPPFSPEWRAITEEIETSTSWSSAPAAPGAGIAPEEDTTVGAAPLPAAPYVVGGRRPVWPLLLAAGTLVAFLMLCAAVSAGLFGLQTLRAQLALSPTGLPPLVERATLLPGVLPITGTLTSDGYLIVVITPGPGTIGPPSTPIPGGEVSPIATPLPSPTFTETPFVFFSPTPFPPFGQFDTPTPRPTPTPRNTPTPFPPFVPPPTATQFPLPSPTFVTTATPVNEPFVVRFVAEPTSIFLGQASTLNYEVRGIRAAFIDDEPITGPVGSYRVTPNKTTTYVMRVIKLDGSVQELSQTVTVTQPTATPSPTVTPTFTPTPLYVLTMAANRTEALIDGTGCQTGNGCAVFQLQVSNLGNRPTEYRLERIPSLPQGWSAFFCFSNGCEFSNLTRQRTVEANALDTIAVNFLLPAVVRDEETGSVVVKGYCNQCASFNYEQAFTVVIEIPPTPRPTGTVTPTYTPTHTPTFTPTATATPTTGP